MSRSGRRLRPSRTRGLAARASPAGGSDFRLGIALSFGPQVRGLFRLCCADVTFESLGLSAELLRAVSDQGYTVPTPIQTQAIPLVLEGRDLMGAAQTGTGKTAAFVLPIFQRLLPQANTSFSPARHPVRALVLTPTRELAMQVAEMAAAYGRHVPLRSAVVFGGVPLDPQIKELRGGVELLVATPGRLLDLVGQRAANLGQVEILVLDEGDRMLDMGFIPDIRRILALLPERRQTLLFSATFSDEIRRLSKEFLHDPATVEVAARNATASEIREVLYPVDRELKLELLEHLVDAHDLHQVLVFTRTKLAARRLASDLDRHGYAATAIHSRPHPGRADPGPRRLQGGRGRDPRRHRRRLPRPRHRGAPRRRQLRAPHARPRTTSTASAAPAAPAPAGSRSASPAPTRSTCCGRSSGSCIGRSRWRSSRTSCPIRRPRHARSTPVGRRPSRRIVTRPPGSTTAADRVATPAPDGSCAGTMAEFTWPDPS